MPQLKDPRCPECGGIATGTVDLIPGAAYISVGDDGDWEYEGETDVFWDGQYNARPDGSPVPANLVRLTCGNNHEWESENDD